jgi:NADH:ubiquinone oxidoreductase subunit 6 (subunit J)
MLFPLFNVVYVTIAVVILIVAIIMVLIFFASEKSEKAWELTKASWVTLLLLVTVLLFLIGALSSKYEIGIFLKSIPTSTPTLLP